MNKKLNKIKKYLQSPIIDTYGYGTFLNTKKKEDNLYKEITVENNKIKKVREIKESDIEKEVSSHEILDDGNLTE